MKFFIKILFLFIFLSNYTSEGQEMNYKADNTEFTPKNFYDSLSIAALSIVNNNIIYTPTWVDIDYPMGDVPELTGVCTDVIIRAYRKMGIDLQQEIHEDILSNTDRYPNIKNPDHNIDHRRVPNISKFFIEYGDVLEITNNPNDYKAGDIIYWKLGGKTDHIGIVTHIKDHNKTPLMIHNICCGQNLEKCLFDYPIYKHFRFKKYPNNKN